jgi:hypothetical protein
MSCKTKIAYLKLSRALVSLLGPFGTLRLVAVSLDFESGLWGAFSTVFPNVSFRGCSFHFSQAVFRQIQKCGLANLYRRNERIRRICRKLMALNLLPHRFIPRLFRDLKTQVRGALTVPFRLYGKDMAKQHCVATEIMVGIHAANSN